MGGILTSIGEQKLAASIGGTPLNLTTVRVGDGNGASITPNRLMTDLVRRVGDAYPVTLSARDNDTPTMWRIRTAIPAEAGPFTVREIGVFDAAGAMIAIASHAEVEFLGAGGDIVSMVLDIVFPVSGQANVSLNVSEDVVVPLAHELRPQWLTINGVLNAPPASPVLGATYIIGSAPTGAWIGQAGAIAQWDGADWALAVAPIGHIVSDNSKAESDPAHYLKLAAGGWQPYQFVSPTEWANILNKPSTFTPSAHSHAIADTTGLQAALDAKATQAAMDGKVAKAGDTMSGALLMPAGTLAAPAIAQSADTNTGIIFPAADTLALVTGGVERFRAGPAGQLGIAGANYGNAGKVLTGNAGGPPAWVDPNTLLNLVALKTSLGIGLNIIQTGVLNAHITNITIPAQPDTGYSVVGFLSTTLNGGQNERNRQVFIDQKTTTSFRAYTNLEPGESVTSSSLYIVYR